MAVSSVGNSHTFKVTTPGEREIVLTRLFDAPRHLVFEAMTKPEHVRRWWGRLDDLHSLIVCDIDLRPGGAWRWVGRGPTTFTEEGGKTRMTVSAMYPSREVRDFVISTGMERGAAISYDRLEEVARELQAATQD